MTPDERERFYKDAERLKLQKIALHQRKQSLDQRKYNLVQRRLEFAIYDSLPDNGKNTNYSIWVKQFREKIKFEKSLEENPVLAKMYEEISTLRKELGIQKESEQTILTLQEKIIKLEKITGHLLKSSTTQSINSIDNGEKNIRDNLKHAIEKGMTEIKLNLLNTEWNLYKPDIEHLHRENIKKASELTDD